VSNDLFNVDVIIIIIIIIIITIVCSLLREFGGNPPGSTKHLISKGSSVWIITIT
jgi:hypothetical protein